MTFLFNAHDICRTRICQAQNCEADATIGQALCEWCETRRQRGHTITLHTLPDAGPPTLRCSGTCGLWKIDDAFPHAAPDPTKGGPRTDRRGRHRECRQCGAERRAKARANLTADLLEELRAYDRKRKAAS